MSQRSYVNLLLPVKSNLAYYTMKTRVRKAGSRAATYILLVLLALCIVGIVAALL